MAQITWRNVDAPSQAVALQGIKQFGDMFGSASKGFGDATSTFDNDTRVYAASPAISAYFQAAATGDPKAANAALAQNAQGFGNLTPDQLSKVFSTGGSLTGAGVGNQAKRFDFDAAMRNDADQQSAVSAFAKLRPGIGTSQDTGPAFNSDAYKALSPVARQHFQKLMTDSGVASPYALADAVAPVAGAATGASGALAKASTGDAGSTTWGRMKIRESGNKQHNADGTVVKSPKGATGISQIMPGTGPIAAKLAGVPWDPKAFEDDENYNERLGKAYFDKQLQDFGGDEAKAAAAYNMGPGSVAKNNGVNGLVAKYGDAWLSHASKETRDYVANTVSNELARGMNQEGKRAGLQTPAQIKTFGDAARVDSAMAKSLANLTGLSNVMGAAGDLTNPSDIASALVTKWDKVPHSVMLGEVNRIADEYKITPAQAGEILLNKGMTANKGSGFLGARWLKDYVTGDPLLGTGYKVNEDQVSTIAAALKSPAGQQLVASNATRDAVTAALQPTQEAYDKSVNVWKELTKKAASNPALNESVARAEANMLRLQSAAQNAPIRQSENPNFGQPFTQPTPPQPVATTTGKVSGAAKVDEMIAEKPAVKPLFNPDAQQTPGSQQARLIAYRQNKAKEAAEAAAKEAADKARDFDTLVAEGKARDLADETRRNKPRVNLAPASNFNETVKKKVTIPEVSSTVAVVGKTALPPVTPLNPEPLANTQSSSLSLNRSTGQTTNSKTVKVPDVDWEPTQTLEQASGDTGLIGSVSDMRKHVLTYVPQKGVATKVTDGDSVRVKLDNGSDLNCRIDSINAPETAKPYLNPPRPGQPGGEEAKAHLQKLIENKEVTVRITYAAAGDKSKNYGRDLCQVSVEGKNVDAEMVRANMAYIYGRYVSRPDNTAHSRLFELTRARDEGRNNPSGIRTQSNAIDPELFNRQFRR